MEVVDKNFTTEWRRFRDAARSPQPEAVERHFGRRGHGEEFEMEARWIVRHVPPSATCVLDIGCGIGALFTRIGPSRVVGMDYTHAGLCRTQQIHPAVRLACGDAARVPIEDGSVHVITAQHLVEHLPDPAAALREWRRVLRTQGVVIIVTPNASFCDPSVFEDPTHVRIYDRRSLRDLLEQSGFTILEITTLGLPWGRNHRGIPGGWRIRRAVVRNAERLGRVPVLREAGQSLCCVARKRDWL